MLLLLVLFVGYNNESSIMNHLTDAIKKSASVCKSESLILKVREQIEKLPKHDIW
jgi:hypothetical protein